MESLRHEIRRIRRERRRRTLQVAEREMLGPHMLRLRFTSEELHDFESAAPDDHIKLFVPDGAGGMAMRDYTPRAFDTATGSLTIDFALHEAGPATAWALGAQIGDRVQIGGPQGSTVVADDFDWYLLIGDETALPAIARRLEELRPGVPVTVFAAVDDPEDCLPLVERPDLTVRWHIRSLAGDDAAGLADLIDGFERPVGDGYVWVAGEASIVRVLRAKIVEDLRQPEEWMRAAGYWSKGNAGSH